jgi:hypothetical protein
MNKVIIFLTIILLNSCKSAEDSSFAFKENNELNFYRVNEETENLLYRDTVTVPKLLEELMFKSSPEKLPAENEIKIIEKYYKKVIIDKKSKIEIAEIFYDANLPINKATFEFGVLCAPVYRDILIFKEDGKVTSIAKICLSCYKNHIVTEKNTFINSEIEFEKLHQLLDNLASH